MRGGSAAPGLRVLGIVAGIAIRESVRENLVKNGMFHPVGRLDWAVDGSIFLHIEKLYTTIDYICAAARIFLSKYLLCWVFWSDAVAELLNAAHPLPINRYLTKPLFFLFPLFPFSGFSVNFQWGSIYSLCRAKTTRRTNHVKHNTE